MPTDEQMAGDLEEARRELDTWKMKVERGDDVKSRLLVEKVEENEAREKAKKDMNVWLAKHEDCKKDFVQSMNTMKGEISKISQRKQDLLDKLRAYQTKMLDKQAEATKLTQKFKINALIPDSDVRFSAQHQPGSDDDSHLIRGVFTITQRPSVFLHGGQALITFEEERVASHFLDKECSVPCEEVTLTVKPRRIIMDPALKFEVHLDISRKELKVCGIPPAMPDERTKDRLEISFSKPSRGGGEVEGVDYNQNNGTGLITFLQPGVANVLAQKGDYQVDLDSRVNVQVGTVSKHQLRKFQTFRGVPKRTVVLDDIKDMLMDEGDVEDNLQIYFQRPRNGGGEIEKIKYLSVGKVVQALFSEDVGTKMAEFSPAGTRV